MISTGGTWSGRPDLNWLLASSNPQTAIQREPHRGRGMEGRAPYEFFKDEIQRKPDSRNASARMEVKTTA